jgi:hypothetical protein
MGGTHDVWRGTGKAEAAKLPDAGISSPRKMGQKKGLPTERVANRAKWERLGSAGELKNYYSGGSL